MNSTAPLVLDGNIWTLVQFGALTGIVTALFNALFGVMKEWFDRRRQTSSSRQFAAQSIVDTLDSYAQDCSQMIAENAHERDQGSTPNYYRLPTLAGYPSGDEWKLFPARLTRRLNDLRSEIDMGNRNSQNTLAVTSDPDSQAKDAELYAALTGWEAIQISDTLRRRFWLGRRKKLVGEGPAKHLKDAAAKARPYVNLK